MTKRRLVLAPKARTDLLDIRNYTDLQWGVTRRRDYLAKITDRLQELLHRPELGPTRDEVRPGLRCLPTGEHVIWYRVQSLRIEIVRVLHGAMDFESHLP